MAELDQRYGLKRVIVLAYHSQANGMIECGNKSIVNALSKISDGRSTNWIQNSPVVL